MNERIRELAFECARQLNWTPPSDPKEYTFSSAGLEKFAELIVRECADIVLQWKSEPFPMDPETAAKNIKDQFGIIE